MKFKVYGSRGSAALSRNSRYGGNTTCMVLENNGEMIILDAGSGLMKLDAELREKYPNYPQGLPFKPNILISHLHLDHVQGLTGFAPIWAKDTHTRIFTCARDDRPLDEQVFGIFAPPYWPVRMASISFADCVPISGKFEICGLTITPFSAFHPDNTLAFHITDGRKTIVYLLDNEITQPDVPKSLMEYCHKADLVIFDAAYTQEDYPKRIGWGHSTVQDGIRLADASGLKRMLFAHYGQEYFDSDLDRLKESIAHDKRFLFAYEGMEIDL